MGEQKIKQAGGEIGRNIRRVRLELGMGQTQRAQHELRRALKIERAPQSTTLKSFLPRFFTKKRARSRGSAPGRAPQRAERPLCQSSAGGGQRGNPRRGFPLCGRPRRPQPSRFADARSHPTPGGGRRNVVRPAETVTAGRRGRRPLQVGWETGRVPRDFPGAGHNAGNSENAARMGGVFTRFSRAATKSAFRHGQGIVRAKLSVCR